ncbi:MAG: hypothetical protein Kow0020_08770 [Wenzhouxiangellaceae bacterium]
MARRQARRSPSAASPFLIGLLTGSALGAGLVLLAWVGGYLPRGDETPSGLPSGRDEPPLVDAPSEDRSGQYEFFTVLPEREVVVPNREIERRARDNPDLPATPGGGNYLIQVGSFRRAEDAESLKARLALIGMTARVQTVTVDGETWHRVRLGPFDTARAADSARRRLRENGFDSLVLSDG